MMDFEYEVDKHGNFYGWGISRYTTPEEFYKNFTKKCYKRTPEQSYKRILRHLKRSYQMLKNIKLNVYLVNN